jgi:hypothetical protein
MMVCTGGGGGRPHATQDLLVAAADSRGKERASGVDHEDGDDNPVMDGVHLAVAVVVQGRIWSDGPRFGLSIFFIF